MGALNRVRVLEISSSLAPAFCAKQFTLWGTEVFTVADAWRQSPCVQPLISGTDDPVSLLHEYVHRGKRFVSQEDLTAEFIGEADVVISDLSRARLAAQFPSVEAWPVMVTFSPFGEKGPYAQYAGAELLVEAVCGLLSGNGEQDKPPLRMPGNMTAYICGAAGFVAALAALRGMHVSGRVEDVEVSCAEVLATIVPFLRTQLEERTEPRDGGPGSGATAVRQYRIADGFLSFNFGLPSVLEAFLGLIGRSDRDIPGELATVRQRRDPAKMREFIASLSSPFTVYELFTILSAPPYRAILGCTQSVSQLLQDPQLAALDHFVEVELPNRHKAMHPGVPARLPRSPGAIPSTPVDWSPATPSWSAREPLQSDSPVSLERPLNGMRIIDLTQAWIGPYASQLLTNLGADVIKVESLKKPDVWRRLPPAKTPGVVNPDAKIENCSFNFNSVNLGKKSLTLDLGNPEGRRLFLELVRDADIVMENYSAGVLSRLGIEYEKLEAANEAIILVSFSGYGNEGPYAAYRANGTTIESVAGWDSLFGYAGGPPLVMGFYQADPIAGMQMAATTLIALEHRRRTGEGQWVQGSMLEAATAYIGEQVMAASLGMSTGRMGNRHPDMAPHGVYRCAGEDEWVAIVARDDADYARLCQVVGDELPGGAYLQLAHRLKQADELDGIVDAWTREQDRFEVTSKLQAEGIPAAPVQRIDEVFKDPHFTTRKWFQALPHPDIGTRLYHGSPWRLSMSDLRMDRASARLGEHNREVLRERLGLTDAEIDTLYRDGIAGEVK